MRCSNPAPVHEDCPRQAPNVTRVNLRTFIERPLTFVLPGPFWRKHTRGLWTAACVLAFVICAAVLTHAASAAATLSGIDANLAYGFARIDPPVIYQEIRGRYSYCGYDWDRRCQLRDPFQVQEPPVDRWLEAHTPAIGLVPPTQGEVASMETEGAQSLIEDDVRIADIEYFLGLFDVIGHVAGQVVAGGFASLVALAISLLIGFAIFGGASMRAVNPLWLCFAFAGAAFCAWAAVHVLAAPAGFGAILTLEVVALAVLPFLGLASLRKRLMRRETAHAYWSAIDTARRGANTPTPTV